MKKYSYMITYIRYNNTDFKGQEFRNTLAEAIDLVNRLKPIAHLSKFKVQKITEETHGKRNTQTTVSEELELEA